MLGLKSEFVSPVSLLWALLSGVPPCVERVENIWYVSFERVVCPNIWPVALSIFNLLSPPWPLILHVSTKFREFRMLQSHSHEDKDDNLFLTFILIQY